MRFTGVPFFVGELLSLLKQKYVHTYLGSFYLTTFTRREEQAQIDVIHTDIQVNTVSDTYPTFADDVVNGLKNEI